MNLSDIYTFQHFTHLGVMHGITQRTFENQPFNLSFQTGNETEIIFNRARLASYMEVESDHLIFPSQTHSDKIVEIKASGNCDVSCTDALMTQEADIGLAVLSADCIPILMYDDKKKAIAAIHSGWKGTVVHLAIKTLVQMKNIYGTNFEDVYVGIGPSIGQDSFEVGEDVAAIWELRMPDQQEFMIPSLYKKDKWHIDLQSAIKHQMIGIGIPDHQIELAQICSVKDARFFSARREGFETGRYAAFIKL